MALPSTYASNKKLRDIAERECSTTCMQSPWTPTTNKWVFLYETNNGVCQGAEMGICEGWQTWDGFYRCQESFVIRFMSYICLYVYHIFSSHFLACVCARARVYHLFSTHFIPCPCAITVILVVVEWIEKEKVDRCWERQAASLFLMVTQLLLQFLSIFRYHLLSINGR